MEQKDTRVAPSSSGSDGERVSKTNNRQQEDPNPSSQKPLNCPRCDSINTKFCYFNNYSNSQPRHFCKSCRRYWTQGGTLRNVPVGGGCRKNKRVRPRSLISMGGPTPFSDPTMLGRLSSCIPSFNGNEGDVDSSSQLLNIAYARFQESMRLTHQSPEGLHYDMSLPPLVQKPCALSSCTNLMMDGFEHNLGFPAAHSAGGDAGYRAVANYDLPSSPALYHAQAHNLMGTSATETLASIEEELSSFSNYPYHVIDSVNTDASQERPGLSMFAESMPCLESGLSYVENSPIVDLLNAHGEDQGTMKEEEKPMISMNGDHNGLSLTMPAENWQPQALSSMNEGLFEPHQGNLWSTNTPRWLDMHPTSVL